MCYTIVGVMVRVNDGVFSSFQNNFVRNTVLYNFLPLEAIKMA